MEIITSYSKTELEQLIIDSVQKALTNRPVVQAPVMTDEMDIDGASELTGYRKATLYHKSFTGDIPSYRRGKRLVFSRREIIRWMEGTTVRKQTAEEIATNNLAAEAEKREGNQ